MGITRFGVSPPDYADLQAMQQSFAKIGAYRSREFELSDVGDPQRIFLSAMMFVIVVAATWIVGRRIEPPAFEFAIALRPPSGASVRDWFGMWTALAVVLVALAHV